MKIIKNSINTTKLLKFAFLSGIFLVLLACAEDQSAQKNIKKLDGRWFSADQVALGKSVYEVNCISCHLENAKGTKEWKKTLDDDSYPPPPLNGTAHAWHHSIEVLLTVINQGGIPNGGKMPAFKNKLSQDQKIAVVAYFQSFWPKDIYKKWVSNQKH